MGSSLQPSLKNTTSINGMAPTPSSLHWSWPETAVLEALQCVQLLEAWLQRYLDQQLQQHWLLLQGSAVSSDFLAHQWFGEKAASLFLQRRRGLEQVLISVLQLQDKHLAQELWFRLEAQEMGFHQLSHHSIGPERELAGRLGPIALQDLDPQLHPLLIKLQPGDLAPPLAQDDGSILLLRLEQRWPARLDQATRRTLERELYDQWRDQHLLQLLQAPPPAGSVVELPLPPQP